MDRAAQRREPPRVRMSGLVASRRRPGPTDRRAPPRRSSARPSSRIRASLPMSTSTRTARPPGRTSGMNAVTEGPSRSTSSSTGTPPLGAPSRTTSPLVVDRERRLVEERERQEAVDLARAPVESRSGRAPPPRPARAAGRRSCSDGSSASGSSTSWPDMRCPENVRGPTASPSRSANVAETMRQPDPGVEDEARVRPVVDAYRHGHEVMEVAKRRPRHRGTTLQHLEHPPHTALTAAAYGRARRCGRRAT